MSVWYIDLAANETRLFKPLPSLLHSNTHAYRLLIFKERLLMCHQHRNEIITRFCLSCQAPEQFFLLFLLIKIDQASNTKAAGASQGKQAINSSTKLGCSLSHTREAKAPASAGAFVSIGSLTMSYFHTGIRTIIGAESFHCPVRDGKEWDQLAMVIRLKTLPGLTRSTWSASDQSIRRVFWFQTWRFVSVY
jgi:hypothetical protein